MNEFVTITQIVEINGNGYVFFYPYGVKFDDIYDALKQLENDNRAKQAQMVEEAEKRRLQQEMKDGLAESV